MSNEFNEAYVAYENLIPALVSGIVTIFKCNRIDKGIFLAISQFTLISPFINKTYFNFSAILAHKSEENGSNEF